MILYAKDTYDAKHEFFINRLEAEYLKPFNDFKAFIECLSYVDDII